MKISTRFRFSRRNFGRFVTLGVLSTALLAPVHVTASPAPVAVATEVEAAFHSFVQAWQNEDLNAAVASFTPDAVAYDPVPPGKFENTAAIRTWIDDTFKALDHISITASDVKIHTAGPVAWLTAHYVFKAQAGDQPAGDEGNLSMVWVKQLNGGYKIALFHASIPPAGGPVAAPPAAPEKVKVTIGSP
jgi:ketosteroid isomerase-like protein